MINKTCSRCGINSLVKHHKRIFYKRSDRKNQSRYYDVFIPVDGRRWRDSICGDCILSTKRKSGNFDSRERSKNPAIMAFVASEKRAEQHFCSLGFSVKRTESTGPDLVCSLGSILLTVEVKRASYSSGSWRVARVRPLRKNDDLVAFVLPNNRVYIDSMKLHLQQCDKSGRKTITKIVEEFGLK